MDRKFVDGARQLVAPDAAITLDRALGMVNALAIMVAAVMAAVGVMLVAALVMIGMALTAEAFDAAVPEGSICAARADRSGLDAGQKIAAPGGSENATLRF